ncbi:MAG: hypothetical protein KC609_24660, partial [Myxococcales bacterium]|nr:hypothetical protein [Myxococcales bacterium]
MGGAGLSDTELDELASFLEVGLVPPPNPNVQGDAEGIARGAELFEERCASCHVDGGSDGLLHDVGTGTDEEEERG